MPGDRRDANSVEETEFGLGAGMIDPGERETRALPVHQQLWEIYAVPRTFDGSGGDELLPPEEVPVPRLLPGEVESDRA